MRMLRAIALFSIGIIFFAAFLPAQTHSSVDIIENTNVYVLLESAQIRGLIPVINQAKPYLKSLVKDNLEKLENKGHFLTEAEKKILNLYLRKYGISKDFFFSALIETDNNFELQNLSHPHSINALGFKVGSNIYSWLSVDAEFSMMLDRTNKDAFLPYTYTKTWDHPNYDTESYADLSLEKFAISNSSREEITLAAEDGVNFVRLGRFRRDWGPGENSLLLSGTGRPFLGFDTGMQFGEFAYFSSTTGSLGHTVSEDSDTEQKMISAHKLTITPTPWLSLSAWESVIFGKRFELAYLSPVSLYIVSQMGIAGDKDNSTMGFDFNANFRNLGRFYGSIFIDEIEHTKIDQLFTYPKNMFAYYTGFKAAIPPIPFGIITFQYTKLEPFVYTHYEQEYPFAPEKININYTNDGENLGYPLPPNSDEFKIFLSFLPAPPMAIDLGVSYIRHGNNKDATSMIMGDIEVPLIYGNMNDYPDKNFLHDGIYEKIFSIFGKISYSLPQLPLNIYACYGFSYSTNSGNTEGLTELRNIITLGGTYTQQIW